MLSWFGMQIKPRRRHVKSPRRGGSLLQTEPYVFGLCHLLKTYQSLSFTKVKLQLQKNTYQFASLPTKHSSLRNGKVSGRNQSSNS